MSFDGRADVGQLEASQMPLQNAPLRACGRLGEATGAGVSPITSVADRLARAVPWTTHHLVWAQYRVHQGLTASRFQLRDVFLVDTYNLEDDYCHCALPNRSALLPTNYPSTLPNTAVCLHRSIGRLLRHVPRATAHSSHLHPIQTYHSILENEDHIAAPTRDCARRTGLYIPVPACTTTRVARAKQRHARRGWRIRTIQAADGLQLMRLRL